MTTSQSGELDEVEAYIEDLTEQSALQQQIRAVQKLEAVGRLAGGVAHDFNNILVVIKLSTEMMLSQSTPDSPLAHSLLQVSHAADRAAALTKQMLAFSRRQVMQFRVVNVNSVVSEILHMLSRIIGEDVQLTTRFDPKLSNAKLDPDQLGQIVINLAVNARDAMPSGGTLQIETANVELDAAYAHTHSPVTPGNYDAGGERYLSWYSASRPAPHLRPVLYHQRDGERHRIWIVDRVWNCETEWRIHLGVQRARTWYYF